MTISGNRPMSGVHQLERYFRELEERDEFSGVVLITRGREQLFRGAYGYASRAWRIPNALDVRYDTASITKLFTAVATLQLVDQQGLGLDTNVTEFLNLEGTAVSRDVNVFHLLTHTSGIGDDADEEAGESYEALWKTMPNYSVTETSDFIPQCTRRAPNFPPGQGCRYCNCGYVLLGLVIERASGMTYRDYVRQHIFARAGMAQSEFLRMDRVHDKVAEGSDPLRDETGRITGWKRNIYSFPPIGSPDGGAHVTAGDLDRFLRAVKAGELLSAKQTTEFFTPRVHHRQTDGGAELFGYGLSFFVDRAQQVVFCQKQGINPGVSGIIRHYPETDVNLVLLSNMERGVWEPARRVHDSIVGG